jgi:hypothetical protein
LAFVHDQAAFGIERLMHDQIIAGKPLARRSVRERLLPEPLRRLRLPQQFVEACFRGLDIGVQSV